MEPRLFQPGDLVKYQYGNSVYYVRVVQPRTTQNGPFSGYVDYSHKDSNWDPNEDKSDKTVIGKFMGEHFVLIEMADLMKDLIKELDKLEASYGKEI